MVNAQEWLDANYPPNGICQRQEDKENYGKTRDQINELDISGQNLEGTLYLNGLNLRKLNVSYNKLTGLLSGSGSFGFMEELDLSHNWFSGSFPQWSTSILRKYNFSHNSISRYLLDVPNLTHLDANNNALIELGFESTINLQKLDCSNN